MKPLAERLQRITDADDPRIAAYRDIRERDLVLNEEAFVAEGTVVLRVLAESHGRAGGFSVSSVLVLENRAAGVADVLARLPDSVPLYCATRGVLDAIAGFAMHRGVLAIGRRAAPADVGTMQRHLPREALVVAGHAISNHDNMGGLFRNAAVFGVDAALFDAQSCHPLYRKAIRVSVGGVFRVPFVHAGNVDDLVAALDANGFDLWGLSPGGSVPLEELVPGRRTALLVGTEGDGLPQPLMGRIRTARIAQAPGMDSLNVATAAAIALHTVARRMGRIG
ncbi:MAG: TrmH family RNA methyltransferase [Pararhizobium sp.]